VPLVIIIEIVIIMLYVLSSGLVVMMRLSTTITTKFRTLTYNKPAAATPRPYNIFLVDPV
jgi:hypothetical protein